MVLCSARLIVTLSLIVVVIVNIRLLWSYLRNELVSSEGLRFLHGHSKLMIHASRAKCMANTFVVRIPWASAMILNWYTREMVCFVISLKHNQQSNLLTASSRSSTLFVVRMMVIIDSKCWILTKIKTNLVSIIKKKKSESSLSNAPVVFRLLEKVVQFCNRCGNM